VAASCQPVASGMRVFRVQPSRRNGRVRLGDLRDVRRLQLRRHGVEEHDGDDELLGAAAHGHGAAGQERYVCYTRTLDADLAVDRFDYAAKSYVHHIFFSRTLQPEPDGVSECDVLFRTTWIPLFVAGNGSAHLAYPQGAATLLPKGTQIVVQLHLLNASSGPQDVNVDIEMRRSTEKNPVAVGLYAFGTQRISLAPNAASSISYECTTRQDVQSFTMLAHMHRLGTKMTLEVADGSGAYHDVFPPRSLRFQQSIPGSSAASDCQGNQDAHHVHVRQHDERRGHVRREHQQRDVAFWRHSSPANKARPGASKVRTPAMRAPEPMRAHALRLRMRWASAQGARQVATSARPGSSARPT